jgi:hypothetical protein
MPGEPDGIDDIAPAQMAWLSDFPRPTAAPASGRLATLTLTHQLPQVHRRRLPHQPAATRTAWPGKLASTHPNDVVAQLVFFQLARVRSGEHSLSAWTAVELLPGHADSSQAHLVEQIGSSTRTGQMLTGVEALPQPIAIARHSRRRDIPGLVAQIGSTPPTPPHPLDQAHRWPGSRDGQ